MDRVSPQAKLHNKVGEANYYFANTDGQSLALSTVVKLSLARRVSFDTQRLIYETEALLAHVPFVVYNMRQA